MNNVFSAQSAQRPDNAYFNSPARQPLPPPPIRDAADHSNLGQQLHQESTSPEGFEGRDHSTFQSNQGQSHSPYVSPPSSTRATLVNQYPYRNTASPEASVSAAVSSPVYQEQPPTRHESSYGAISAETSGSEPRTHVIDQEAANSASEKASNFSMDDSVELRHESHGTTLAPTVGGINQVEGLYENPSRNVAAERPSQPVSNYEPSSVLNNASALGVGGPSDWEYFGDYATEEVDDTELYSTSKAQASHIPVFDTAELPSEPLPSNEGDQRHDGDLADANTEQPQALIPSPDSRTSPKHMTQSLNVSQSLEHQFHQPTPPLHPELSLPASTRNIVEAERTLPDHSHDSESEAVMQTSTEAPASCVEDSRFNSHDSSSTQKPKPDDGKLDVVPTEKPDREVAALSAEGHLPSKLLGSQNQRDEKPFQSEASPTIRKSRTPTPPHHGQSDSSAPTLAKLDIHSPSVSKERADPYADLDDWAKASLNRYVAMLRQEAQATTNQEKHKTFITFTNRESRLRAVLYEAEVDEDVLDPKPLSVGPANDAAKPRPASHHAKEKSTQVIVDELVTSPEIGDPHVELVASPNDQKSTDSDPTTEPTRTEDPFMMIESPDNIQYSPGGRPIVTRPVNPGIHHNVQLAPAPRRKTPKIESVQDAPHDTNEAHSPGSDAPMVVEPEAADREKQLEALKSITMRHSGYPGIQRYTSPPPNAPDRPVYTPFRHHDGDTESGDRSTNRSSVYRPYSAQKMASLDSGIDKTRPLETRRRGTLNSPLVTKTEHGEMLNGTTMSNTVPDILGVGPRRTSPDPSSQVKTLSSNVSALVLLETVLPEHNTPNPDPPPLRTLRQAGEAIVDDFSFIRKTVLTWDTKAKKLRERHDKARHSRQVESEERINGLFDEQQIGYGDISVLEAEFKASEAAKKADEDRAEYETFSTDVYDVVWARLHDEINELIPLYSACTQMLNDALAGKDMFEGFGSRPALAPAMEMSLSLHQRLENRHQKAFEAVLERNRRLKKIQVAPLYALGSITEVKKLERQFEDAERKAILGHCQNRAKRAHGLMNVLYQNTQRGVGANQDSMEAIMQALKRIADDRASDPSRYLDDPGALRTIVVKAESVVAALARSSEHVVQMFHVADKLLSSADYEVSVAEARLVRADAAMFKQRGEEKAKEDVKLVYDLEHRLTLIRQDFKRTNDEIAKVFSVAEDKQVDKATPKESSRPSLGSSDPAHEERIQRALEEAKERNALRDVALNNNAY